MHCECCDKMLSNRESVLKHAITEEYLNTCLKCLNGLGIPYKGRFVEEEIPEDDPDIELFKDNWTLLEGEDE